MDIRLNDEQSAWLVARVEAGEFISVEDAVRHLLDEIRADSIDIDDLDWAKPYVDEALEAVARGEVISLDEHEARTAALLTKLRDA